MSAPVVPFVRPLYSPSNEKGPVTDNDDITAVKRAISRAGYYPWQQFDDTYSEHFAMDGVREFQQKNGLSATGNYGENTHEKLRWTRCKAKPDEWAFDSVAIEMMKSAKEELTTQNKNIPLMRARKLLAYCRNFSGPYVWGGQHDGSLADDSLSSGFDCSSSTSKVLFEFGLLGSKVAQVSSWFEKWGEPGRGKYVTIHATYDHVWIEFSLPEGYFRFDTSPYGDGPHGPRVRTRQRPDARFVTRHPKNM